jgi:hypothetical protein
MSADMALEAGSLTINFGRIYPVLLPAFFTDYNHISNSPTRIGRQKIEK